VRIVVVGGGQVGTTLAEKLSQSGHDVALVERDPERAAALAERLDVEIVEGNGATMATLRRAGAGDAALVLATSDSDEVNFITGRVAAAVFKVPQVVVRLRDPAHEEAFAQLSRGEAVAISYVNPDAATVERIEQLLEVPGALDVASFMDGDVLVAGFRIPAQSEFAERPVSDMRLFFAETPSLVAAIQRGERAVVPHGQEMIRGEDIVYFALAREDLEGVLALLGAEKDARRRVMVAGATRVGLALARRLEAGGKPVTLVEPRAFAARAAAEALSSTLVVRGSATSEALLAEEGIERVNTFVAVTDDHETNLVAGLLAKRMGALRAFAMVDNPALANLIGDMPIDAVISPRLLAQGLMLRHVPSARLRSMAALLGDRVEVLEAEAEKGSRICADKLAALSLPRGVLVAALRRGEALMLPRGDDRIEPGDDLLVVATTEHVQEVSDFLSRA
jgi:trk system potassium uptake protein TrkA